MDIIIHFFRSYPEMAIFLTLGIGFWVGSLKYKNFSLGTVTSVLLVGVLVGQMNIDIPGPLKSVFFLLFLFAIGYSVGPQFFQSLRSDGIHQVIFACIFGIVCIGSTYLIAKIMGYNAGMTIGLFAGAQTISAAIGVGTDTIGTLGISAEKQQEWLNIIPVCYAVTYIFGTIGSAYILGTLGPRLLGGLEKVKNDTRALEKELKQDNEENDPALMNANRPVVFRAYKIESDWFKTPQTVKEIEKHIKEMGRRVFVERVRIDGEVLDITPKTVLKQGDEVVLSGRRETIIEDESWIGPEIFDPELLDFPVEDIFVLLTNKELHKKTVRHLRSLPCMHGIIIKHSHTDTRKGAMNTIYHYVRSYMLGRKARLVAREAHRKRGRLLDIGTGTGYFADTMARRGWKVEAVEKSPQARAFAKEHFDLDVKPESALKEFAPGSFDVITLWHVMEHLEHLNETWEMLRELLTEKGMLIVAVPNCSSYDAGRYGEYWAAYDVPRHLWHFTPVTIQQLASRHGFIMAARHPMPFDAFYVSMLSEKHRGSSCSFLKGMYAGTLAWFSTLGRKERSSSMIYVFRKKR